VANSLAEEVIALLHGILSAPEAMAADMWAVVIEQVSQCTTRLISNLLLLVYTFFNTTALVCSAVVFPFKQDLLNDYNL